MLPTPNRGMWWTDCPHCGGLYQVPKALRGEEYKTRSCQSCKDNPPEDVFKGAY